MLTPQEILTAISIVSTPITFYVGYKLAKKDAKQQIEQWINSDTGQKAIYSIGLLLGNAIKQGVGLGTGGGKMKFENLLVQAGIGFLQNKGILPGAPAQQDLSSQ